MKRDGIFPPQLASPTRAQGAYNRRRRTEGGGQTELSCSIDLLLPPPTPYHMPLCHHHHRHRHHVAPRRLELGPMAERNIITTYEYMFPPLFSSVFGI